MEQRMKKNKIAFSKKKKYYFYLFEKEKKSDSPWRPEK